MTWVSVCFSSSYALNYSQQGLLSQQQAQLEKLNQAGEAHRRELQEAEVKYKETLAVQQQQSLTLQSQLVKQSQELQRYSSPRPCSFNSTSTTLRSKRETSISWPSGTSTNRSYSRWSRDTSRKPNNLCSSTKNSKPN